MTEALRTHTQSRFLHAEKRLPAIALGRVRVGEGAVLFDQFAPPAGKRTRFARLRNRLLANLGHRFPGSLLDGEAVPSAAPQSQGYPQTLYVYNGPCDAGLHRQMVESTAPSMERMSSSPILNLVAWRSLPGQDGLWRAGTLDTGQDICLYYGVWSPTPRRNLDTNLDVPNPEALTFLDLEGTGSVEVTVNAVTYDPVILEGSATTVSDIPLEMGGNHVLIRWTPSSPDAALRMQWRNIMREPEVDLLFGQGGSSD